MPNPSVMAPLSFEQFYAVESKVLAAWLRSRGMAESDADDVVQQCFQQILKAAAARPEAWTRAYVFQTARGILHKRKAKADRALLESLDLECGGPDDDGETRAARLAAPRLPETPPAAQARLERVRHELRRMPWRMRAAFAIPTIYGLSNRDTAEIVGRSLTRVDHLRIEARVAIEATFGQGHSHAAHATLLRPMPEPEAIELPIRPRPTPALAKDGSLSLVLAGPRGLESPPPCFAILHLAIERDGETLAVQSEPCPVSWSMDGAGSWCASLRPSFDVPAKQLPGAGALVLGAWFFEGDWMAGG